MGIEYLNSAAAAAGFAMVSEEGFEETDLGHEPSRVSISIGDVRELVAQTTLPAVIDPGKPSGPTLGARVTGLFDSWLSKS